MTYFYIKLKLLIDLNLFIRYLPNTCKIFLQHINCHIGNFIITVLKVKLFSDLAVCFGGDKNPFDYFIH